jgi:DNA-binding IclR family transcriptional regulator
VLVALVDVPPGRVGLPDLDELAAPSAEWNTAEVAGNTSTPGASVTSRALALLGAFDEEHRRLSLTALAARAELPVPTAHRLVGELVEWGALARSASGEYVVGRRLWDLGMLAPVQAGLVETASPYLHDLYGATLATVHLAVRDGDEVLYLDRLRGNASVPVVSTVGSRLPMHATGVGKVLLAHAPADVQARVLADLYRVTAYTVSQPGRLRRQLTQVLRDDYATTQEEMSLGACSVAVPVRHRHEVVAALGLVVPSLKRDRPKLVTALTVAARGIGRALEFRPAEASDRRTPP